MQRSLATRMWKSLSRSQQGRMPAIDETLRPITDQPGEVCASARSHVQFACDEKRDFRRGGRRIRRCSLQHYCEGSCSLPQYVHFGGRDALSPGLIEFVRCLSKEPILFKGDASSGV
nr:hypothetical protein CFP56_44325 [Quercus suber]